MSLYIDLLASLCLGSLILFFVHFLFCIARIFLAYVNLTNLNSFVIKLYVFDCVLCGFYLWFGFFAVILYYTFLNFI